MSFTTLTGPILIYGSECWPLSKKDGKMLRTFERRILRMIYGPTNDNAIWRTRYRVSLKDSSGFKQLYIR
jgi:hypothetical protein